MKIIFLSFFVLLIGCLPPQLDIEHTHTINLKHLPIEFEEYSGIKCKINKGNYVELIGQVNDKWIIKTLIDGNLKQGKISKKGSNGNPVLVYLAEFDREINISKGFCNEIQLPEKKVLTLRTRPLNEVELKNMIEDRLSEESINVNKETVIFSIQSGVKFELISDDFGGWRKIKIYTRNMSFTAFVSKEANGIPTRKNNCN